MDKKINNKLTIVLIVIAILVVGYYIYSDKGPVVSAQGFSSIDVKPDKVSVYISIEQKNYEKRDIVIRDVASTLNDEINLAHSSTDGYFRRFDIPQDILGIDYNISINSNDIYIITEDDKHALSITTLNVTGQPQTGQNTIKKESGSVRLN